MLKTSSDRLRALIQELSEELSKCSEKEGSARPLRQALALMQAASESLDEVESARARAAANVRRLALVTPGR